MIEQTHWSKPEHVPGPVCWLRNEDGFMAMITAIRNSGVRVAGHEKYGWLSWEDLNNKEYSTDLRAWSTCAIEGVEPEIGPAEYAEHYAVPAPAQAPAWFEPCPEWVEYQATDEHGAIWGYQIKPQPGDIGDTVWYHQGGLSYRLGTSPPPANWRETLVARPKPKEGAKGIPAGMDCAYPDPADPPEPEDHSPAGDTIAPGHNPDRLTVAQVGEGWRLLDEDEVSRQWDSAFHLPTTCRIWLKCGQWSSDDLGYRGSDDKNTYSTRLTRAQLRAARGLAPELAPQDDAADREWEARDRARDEWGGQRKTSRDNNAFDDGWRAALAYARAQARAEVGKDLAQLRTAGWCVAVHNDYRVNGEHHTFWLFTHPNGKWLKGEGATDAEALAQVRAAQSRAGAGEGQKP